MNYKSMFLCVNVSLSLSVSVCHQMKLKKKCYRTERIWRSHSPLPCTFPHRLPEPGQTLPRQLHYCSACSHHCLDNKYVNSWNRNRNFNRRKPPEAEKSEMRGKREACWPLCAVWWGRKAGRQPCDPRSLDSQKCTNKGPLLLEYQTPMCQRGNLI